MSMEYRLNALVVSKEIYDNFLTEENPDTSRWITVLFSVENYCSEQYLVITANTGVLGPLEDYLEKLGEPTQVIEGIGIVMSAFYHVMGWISYFVDIGEFTYYIQGQEHQYDGKSRASLIGHSGPYKWRPNVVDSYNVTERDIITVLFQCIYSKRKEIAELIKSEFVNITNAALNCM